jgi:hypothetical protein
MSVAKLASQTISRRMIRIFLAVPTVYRRMISRERGSGGQGPDVLLTEGADDGTWCGSRGVHNVAARPAAVLRFPPSSFTAGLQYRSILSQGPASGASDLTWGKNLRLSVS